MQARTLWSAVILAVILAACRSGPVDELPSDPARRKALVHLGDGRSIVRITAMRELAPKASRYETYAIAKAAKNEDEEVRREAALALGKAPPPESIDLLGEFLRDPMDGVREAAITSLGGKHDPKADAYVASAYEKGGPRTRAAIAETTPAILAKSLGLEAAARKERVDKVLHVDFRHELEKATKERRIAGTPRPDPQVKASALEELGRAGTPEGIAELASRLTSDEPQVAAGAALGLARAKAADQLPVLVTALGSPEPLVANAAAMAIGELAPEKAQDALVNALARHEPVLSASVLEAVSNLTLTPDQRAKVCDAAKAMPEPSVATALYRRAGITCVPTPELPENVEEQGAKWLVLAALGPKNAALEAKARAALSAADATVAASAAAYLAIWGEVSDGKLLRDLASSELTAIEEGHERDARQRTQSEEEIEADRRAHEEAMRQVLELSGKKLDEQKDNALDSLLKRKARASEALTREARTGSLELVAATAAGAARLGADVTELGERLLAAKQNRVRLLAVEMADIGGAALEPLREKLRASEDAEVRTTMLLRDADSERPGAWERLLAAPNVPVAMREDVVRVLARRPEAARQQLLAAAGRDDASTAPALRALAKVAGKDVDAVFAEKVLSNAPGFALAAVDALAERPGPEADAALARAAVYPEGVVREAAVSALAARRACAYAARLAPLAGDYEVRVRLAARALAAACPPPVATP